MTRPTEPCCTHYRLRELHRFTRCLEDCTNRLACVGAVACVLLALSLAVR